MTDYYSTFELYQALRNQLMAIVTDKDLAFSPGGDNPSLGALCKQIGEVQVSYIESFKTYQQDFDYRMQEPGLQGSVDGLLSWFHELDKELRSVIESYSEEDLRNKVIDRGGNFIVPPQIQLEIYKEALLIFYGKCSVYLRLLGKTLPEQWLHWIG